MRIYNMEGRRDNKYKARIKILVKELGVDAFREKVEAQWQFSKDTEATLTEAELARCKSFFSSPDFEELPDKDDAIEAALQKDLLLKHWVDRNVAEHKQSGYCIVTLCLKDAGAAPGDITDRQMEFVADLAERYSFSELRITHEQNLTLADVRIKDLYEIYTACKTESLATPYLGLLNDIVCCPGGDYCSLANAKSIPIAKAIQRRFDDFDRLNEIGDITLNISGCMNACGHHHVGNIGILGVDKKGEEFYQIALGGNAGREAEIAKILGPSFAQEEIPDVIEKIIQIYLDERHDNEKFIDTYHRLGMEPFKERVYAKAD